MKRTDRNPACAAQGRAISRLQSGMNTGSIVEEKVRENTGSIVEEKVREKEREEGWGDENG
jgi:hypothetical protein